MIAEKIYCTTSRSEYTIHIAGTNGENKSTCPECSESRKKKNDKCLSYNFSKGAGKCHHCGAAFVRHEVKEDEKPIQWQNFTSLPDKAVQYFQSRLIGQEVIKRMNITWKDGFICFPYYKQGHIYNVKHRNNKKEFRLEKGGSLIWYNYDAILQNDEVIIVEGEFDALAFMQCGYQNVISVPNGANGGTYIDNSIEDLEKVKTFYLCTDNDTKGKQLETELINRLRPERCKICDLKDFKDANEYLQRKGHESLTEVIETAKYAKVEGIVYADENYEEYLDYFNRGFQGGFTLGSGLDELVTWERKRLAVFTGVPGSGKSEFTDWMNCKFSIMYGWKVAYFSPENFPNTYHKGKLASKLIGKKFGKDDMTMDEFTQSLDYIKDNFFWVQPDNGYDLDNILSKFSYLVRAKGVKVVCLDPFNKIEYRSTPGMSKLDFISQALDKMIYFAKSHDVLFQLVAHPKKLRKNEDGTYPIPTMYDISGSSDFWNKTDYGLIISRSLDDEFKQSNEGICHIAKVKFKHLGGQGAWDYVNNYNNGRYEGFDVGGVRNWDNGNWINTKVEMPWA